MFINQWLFDIIVIAENDFKDLILSELCWLLKSTNMPNIACSRKANGYNF